MAAAETAKPIPARQPVESPAGPSGVFTMNERIVISWWLIGIAIGVLVCFTCCTGCQAIASMDESLSRAFSGQ